MIAQGNVKEEVRAALSGLEGRELATAAEGLLGALGYHSERTPRQSGRVDDFISQLPAPKRGTSSEQEFRKEATAVHVVFQFTDTEIAASAQASLLDDAPSFDEGNAKSFLFTAVDLQGESYPRGKYAAFTREVNKRISAPVVVLFRNGTGKVTLAFAHRRQNRRNPERDVLGNVSLIREIDAADPHRAHLDIFAELSLPQRLKWMASHDKQRNFDGLLAAWLDALDTEELNRRFYRELFGWFERAVEQACFPQGEAKAISREEHVIRLITRLLFVWFIKEKGLVAEDLFVEERVEKLLKDYDRDAGDSYYRAVLQNLFFATLNTEIGRRRFSGRVNPTHRDFSLYRYRKEIADENGLLELFGRTPFINGGLFDCLDSEAATGDGGYRIDCFSDVHYHKLSIPNRLFFGESGVIDLFERYKFTVEENTPAEQEVALDPELLGKVFENLLAANTPETAEKVRKQTGSYYTPRAVVEYMVDEALVGALARKALPPDEDEDFYHQRLRYLLDYEDAFSDADTLFTPKERKGVVRAIGELRVLDPAVGSGAFPMGILHKLTLALRRLDQDNRLWQGLQREKAEVRAKDAFRTEDQKARREELTEISDTFERYRDSDFGRKLYLIQNSIYGVDIQPIACQIAKLRFFISLAIEQRPNEDEGDNYGIKPLPNLETRFVAANTLLGLDTSTQMTLGQTGEVPRLQRELRANRERHFHATTRRRKLECRRRDANLRRRLADALRGAGFSAESAEQLAAWDAFDQNAGEAKWFDAEYMFGVSDGFDVVITNPPYVQLQKDGGRLAQLYKDADFKTFARTGDIYQLFYEKGMNLSAEGTGLLAYVTSNSWLKAEYGRSTRRYFTEKHTPLRLLEIGKEVFENAIVDASIFIVRNGKSDATSRGVDMDRLADKSFPPEESFWGDFQPDGERPWIALSSIERQVMNKIEATGTPLKEWEVSIYRGVTTGLNSACIRNEDTKQALVKIDPKSAEIIKPVLRGRDIQRYRAKYAGRWLIDTHNGYGGVPAIDVDAYPSVKAYLNGFWSCLEKRYDKGKTPYNLRNCAYHEEFAKEKLVWLDLTERGRFAYDREKMFCVNTAFIMSGQAIKYLCAVLNSKLATWFMSNVALNSGMGISRWIPVWIERIPVPRIDAGSQRPFVSLVDRILSAKQKDASADTLRYEREIDVRVYTLYGLTEDEVRVVEGE